LSHLPKGTLPLGLSRRHRPTPEQFTDTVAAYYEQKVSYNQQYNNWPTSQTTSSTLNLRPKDNMPAHEAEEHAGGAAGSTSPLYMPQQLRILVQHYSQARAVYRRSSVRDLANSVALSCRHLRPSRQGLQGLDRIRPRDPRRRDRCHLWRIARKGHCSRPQGHSCTLRFLLSP